MYNLSPRVLCPALLLTYESAEQNTAKSLNGWSNGLAMLEKNINLWWVDLAVFRNKVLYLYLHNVAFHPLLSFDIYYFTDGINIVLYINPA